MAYLELRGRKWHLLFTIPPKVTLLDAKGKRKARFCVSLKTEDRKVAERRAGPFITRWLTEIEAGRNGGSRDALEEDARFYAQALQHAGDAERDVLLGAVADKAREMADGAAARAGILDHRAQGYDETQAHQEAGRFVAIATGKLVRLDEHLEDYLGTLRITQRAIDTRRVRLKKVFTEFTYVQDVQRKAVQEWVNRQLGDGKRLVLLKYTVREWRGYWEYLVAIGVATDGLDPLDKLSMPRREVLDRSGERQPWAPADVVKLRVAAKSRGDQKLADLIELGMWTGARLDELCSMKVERVNLTDNYFEIVDAKSAAGWRQVPIHTALKATVVRLVNDRKDGFLVTGLNEDKYGKRSNTMSARFSTLKKGQGYDKRVVFHSIRKTVATLLENALVPLNVAADLLGHEKVGITYNLYSGGLSLEVKREALEKVSYPAG